MAWGGGGILGTLAIIALQQDYGGTDILKQAVAHCSAKLHGSSLRRRSATGRVSGGASEGRQPRVAELAAAELARRRRHRRAAPLK